MANWTFMTNHARVLLCIARDPGGAPARHRGQPGHHRTQRLRHRRRPGRAGYIVKHKDGRRNRYQIQAHLPLPEPTRRERTVGEVLALLAGTGAGP